MLVKIRDDDCVDPVVGTSGFAVATRRERFDHLRPGSEGSKEGVGTFACLSRGAFRLPPPFLFSRPDLAPILSLAGNVERNQCNRRREYASP